MFNKLKIGTKLTLGFVIVLVLLVIVWQVGRWAVIKKVLMAQEVNAAKDISQAGLKMQRDILEAQVAADNETMTREKEYADEVVAITQRIKEEHENDFKLIVKDNVKATYREILNKVDAFAKSDANSWQCELRRKKAVAERFVIVSRVMGGIETMETHIEQEAASRSADNAMSSMDVMNLSGKLIRNIGDVRRLYTEYSSLSGEAKQDHRKLIGTTYDYIVDIAQELALLLESDNDGKKILAELNADLTEWQGISMEVLDAEDAYDASDARTGELGKEMLAGINDLLPIFEERAADAIKADEEFDSVIKWVLMIFSLAAILFGGVVSLILNRNIAGGVRAAAAGVTYLAETGDLNFEVPPQYLARQDEIGDLAHSVDLVTKAFHHVATMAKELAGGNWQNDVQIRGDLDTMNQDLSSMLDQVNTTLQEINESVQQVATGSREVSNAAQALSNGAQESAASLEQITASMQEISSQTKQNAESAGQARDLAQTANRAAIEGQDAMREMTDAMELITNNSNEIQRVIKVIDDIAFQTNLLALNAAVEAARAGQHGKGFAVVAEEVRNLASRSAAAAKETSDLIAKSGHEIEKGGEIATRTAVTLNSIVDQVKQTTELVAGIAIASNEQAQGVNQVALGLQQIDAVTQQNTASAEESASAANEMHAMATNLQKLVGQFKLRST
ncbi:MAG: methyl-accepting chemotaxis protein [Planctomycetaceae bacterium]|nr:methyl-accepting chemotaxis protein [Planctomycetaceae bacterium]